MIVENTSILDEYQERFAHDMRGVEKWLHERYASKRVNGEWFELSDEDIQEMLLWEKMNL